MYKTKTNKTKNGKHRGPRKANENTNHSVLRSELQVPAQPENTRLDTRDRRQQRSAHMSPKREVF